MQQTPGASPRSKNRYRTPLPFYVPPYEEVAPFAAKPRADVKRMDNRPPERTYVQPSSIASSSSETLRRPGTAGSADSNATQLAVQSDAWLPYTRKTKPAYDVGKLLAELDSTQQLEKVETTSSGRTVISLQKSDSPSSGRTTTSASTVNPNTDSSNSSEPSPDLWEQDVRQPPQKPFISDNIRRPSSDRFQSPDSYQNVSGLQNGYGTTQARARSADNRNNPLRSQSPTSPSLPNYSRPFSPVTANAPPPRAPSRDNYFVQPQPPLPVKSPRRQMRKEPARPKVDIEVVEGVRLETQPKDVSEQKDGLSLPEVEARDIRTIPDEEPETPDEESLHSTRSRRAAHSPPNVGESHDYVRTISPRPVHPGETHAFFDRYSRAPDLEEPKQVAQPPKERARPTDLDTLNEVDEDPAGAAEPPNIARTRAFEQQDEEMHSRTHHAKNLIGGMLKGLSGHTKHHEKDDSHTRKRTSTAEPKVLVATLDGSEDPNSRTRWHDSSDDSDNAQAMNSIWSPNDIRRSEGVV